MIAQILIAVFGLAAVWLVNHEDPAMRRWGPVCGLLSQPAWFWTTYTHEQWAIFVLSFFYAWAWLKGIRTYWMTGGRRA